METKNYSFLNIKKVIDYEGKEVNGVTACAMVVSPTAPGTTSTGRKYIRCSLPIKNQGPRIWSACGGIAPDVAADGTVWAQATFWGTLADRFEKFLVKHPSAVIVVTGTIRVEKSSNGDKEYANTYINADDFMFVRDVKPNLNDKHPAAESPSPTKSENMNDAPVYNAPPHPEFKMPENDIIGPEDDVVDDVPF